MANDIVSPVMVRMKVICTKVHTTLGTYLINMNQPGKGGSS